MERSEIETLRDRVTCAMALEAAGFELDKKESSRRALKYRSGTAVIIVTHEGKGWFDPLSEAKGDVFKLVEHIDHVSFREALSTVGSLIGFELSEREWQRTPCRDASEPPIQARWQSRRIPWQTSATWRYLSQTRHIPHSIIRAAISQDALREGPYGSMWAAHKDLDGNITGWEERGPEWRGFSSGGAKMLFRIGDIAVGRFCVTEAAIDAMSLAALEGLRTGTAYLSTGGGWSEATEETLRLLARRENALLVAATDANSQGEAFASRLRVLAEETDCSWQRLRPPADDWNEHIKEEGMKRRKENGVPHTRSPRQG